MKAWQGFLSNAILDGLGAGDAAPTDSAAMGNRDDDGTQERDERGRWAAMSDADLDSESKNVRAQFDAVQKQHRAYNAGQNEGARDGYNPHEGELSKHAARVTAIEKEKEKRDWTPEKTASRRAAWNAEIMRRKTSGEQMNLYEIQKKMGFRFDQMKEHIARHGLVKNRDLTPDERAQYDELVNRAGHLRDAALRGEHVARNNARAARLESQAEAIEAAAKQGA